MRLMRFYGHSGTTAPSPAFCSTSPHIAAHFTDHPNVVLSPNGVPQAELRVSATDPSPKPRTGPVVVYAGTTLFDTSALTRSADARPNWHINFLDLQNRRPLESVSLGTESGISTLRLPLLPMPTSVSPHTPMNGGSRIRRPTPIASCFTATAGRLPAFQTGSPTRASRRSPATAAHLL